MASKSLFIVTDVIQRSRLQSEVDCGPVTWTYSPLLIYIRNTRTPVRPTLQAQKGNENKIRAMQRGCVDHPAAYSDTRIRLGAQEIHHQESDGHAAIERDRALVQ
jgi:hypothetical protein